MTTLQILLTVPFVALGGYVTFNVFDTFKLMLYKGQIGNDIRKKRRKRFKIIVIAMIVYVVFAFLAFFINYVLTSGK